MVQAHVPCEVPSWLLRRSHCRLDVASRSKKSFTQLNWNSFLVLLEYVENIPLCTLMAGRRRGNWVVSLSLKAPPTSGHCPRRQVYTPPNCMRCGRLFDCVNSGMRRNLLCTDSLSFRTALNNTNTVDPLFQQMMVICHALEKTLVYLILLFGVYVM